MPSIPRSPTAFRLAGLCLLLVQGSQAAAADLPSAERDVSALVAVPASGCTFPHWVEGRSYPPLSIVSYRSKPYFAKEANPGYIPTVSTYFWGPYSCQVSGPPPARCTYTEWMQEWPYAAGSVVAYQGTFYRAKHDNPGFIPTVSTWFWEPYDCAQAASASLQVIRP